jgi:hypothetical protein
MKHLLSKATQFWQVGLVIGTLLFQSSVYAQVWAYIDEQGTAHFASSQINPQYQLFATSKVPVANSNPPPNADLSLSNEFHLQTKFGKWLQTSADYSASKYYLQEAANKHGISYELLQAISATESGFKKNIVSPKGAIGLMQIMPDTAKRFGLKDQNSAPLETLLKEPSINLEIAAKYLNYLATLYPHRLDLILASYNAGEGAVAKYGHQIPPYKETQNYVKTISNLLVFFQSNAQLVASHNTASLFKKLAGTSTANSATSNSPVAKNNSSFMVLGGAKGRGNMMVNLPITSLPVTTIVTSNSLKTSTQSIAATPEFSKDNSSLKLD